MLKAIIEYRFLQNAVAACVMASVVCGIIGVIIVEKKLVMLSGGIAHTSYGGIGLGYLLGFEPILGALLFSLIAAVGIGYVNRKGYPRSEVLISLFWSVGMALGILFIALVPGYPPDLGTYLFGNILTVTKGDLFLMSALTLTVVLAILILFNHWKGFLFDEEFSAVAGIKTSILEYLVLILIALSVVVLIKTVGIILVLALLTIPAALSGFISNKLGFRMFLSILFGSIFCILGLFISYYANIASGAAIVLLASVCFAAAFITRQLKK